MFNKIFVPLDGSRLAETILPHVRELLKCSDTSPAEVVLATVTLIPSVYHAIDEKILQADIEACRVYLGQVAAGLRTESISVTVDVSEGALSVAESLVEMADKHGVNCIAISTHGRVGIGRWLLGSAATKIVRLSKVPVYLFRPGPIDDV